MKLGAARGQARAASRLIDIEVAPHSATFSFALNRKKLRKCGGAAGRISCAPICVDGSLPSGAVLYPARRGRGGLQDHEDDLQLRPIYHQLEERIEAHIFVAFLAYCLHVTLRAPLKPLAEATPRAVLDKLAAVQMLDVNFPPANRWPHLGHAPLHRVGARAKAPGQATQARSAAATTTTHHSASNDGSRPTPPPVVETSAMHPLILLTFSRQLKSWAS